MTCKHIYYLVYFVLNALIKAFYLYLDKDINIHKLIYGWIYTIVLCHINFRSLLKIQFPMAKFLRNFQNKKY